MRITSINTFKVAGAAILAILVASWLHLDHAISAGIVAILTIQPTKKETIRTALSRALAFLVALCIAYMTFHTIGFTMEGFFLYLIVFILLCQHFHWLSAMAMDSVIISHFLTFGDMSLLHVGNEVTIFVIGIVCGIVANLHLHKNVPYIEQLKAEADAQIKKILYRMSRRMQMEDKSDYNGDCFKELNKVIHQAEMIARENFDNQLTDEDTYDLQYIAMRKKQQASLYEMYKIVRSLRGTPETIHAISAFLEKVSIEYQKENTVQDLLNQFYQLDQSMRDTPLPTRRDEFEDRALLYGLLRKMEEFLMIKAEFAKEQGKVLFAKIRDI